MYVTDITSRYLDRKHTLYIWLPKGFNQKKFFLLTKPILPTFCKPFHVFKPLLDRSIWKWHYRFVNSLSDSISITALMSTTVWQHDSISQHIYLLIWVFGCLCWCLSSSLFSFHSTPFTLLLLLHLLLLPRSLVNEKKSCSMICLYLVV